MNAVAAGATHAQAKGALTWALAWTLLAAAGAQPTSAQDLAVVGGEIHTVSGSVLSSGTVLIRQGRIVAVGTDVSVPAGVEVIDAVGMVVTPGFIDSRTSLGLPQRARADRSRLIRGDAHMIDHLEELTVPGVFGQEARETRVHPWLMGGVTAVVVSPGAQNLVGGFGALVKLTDEGFGAVVTRETGLAASFGASVLQAFDAPTTRQGMVKELRQWLIGLGEAAMAAEPGARARTPELDLLLRGRLPLRVVANTPDDIVSAIRLAREFELQLVLEVAAGAHEVAELLADAGASVVVGPSMIGAGGGGSYELFAHTAENAARLYRAGVPIALSTDANGGRSVVMEAVVARAHGLPPEAALRAVTLDAARMAGVADRLGSLEVGKDGDLVVWRGDPVGTWGETRVVVVDGKVVFRR